MGEHNSESNALRENEKHVHKIKFYLPIDIRLCG